MELSIYFWQVSLFLFRILFLLAVFRLSIYLSVFPPDFTFSYCIGRTSVWQQNTHLRLVQLADTWGSTCFESALGRLLPVILSSVCCCRGDGDSTFVMVIGDRIESNEVNKNKHYRHYFFFLLIFTTRLFVRRGGPGAGTRVPFGSVGCCRHFSVYTVFSLPFVPVASSSLLGSPKNFDTMGGVNPTPKLWRKQRKTKQIIVMWKLCSATEGRLETFVKGTRGHCADVVHRAVQSKEFFGCRFNCFNIVKSTQHMTITSLPFLYFSLRLKESL